jgi:hypothetical protein
MMWAAPVLVCAQTFETIGIRAQGMGGAFVAIADDASATWWNPAGLASGALLSGIVERGMADAPSEDTTVGLSFVVPSLCLSYYRLRTSGRTAGFVGSAGGEPPAWISVRCRTGARAGPDLGVLDRAAVQPRGASLDASGLGVTIKATHSPICYSNGYSASVAGPTLPWRRARRLKRWWPDCKARSGRWARSPP